MATIDIGKIKPVFRGTYDNSTAYVLDDIVYYNGSSYVAKTSTTGNLPTDTTKWNILASGSGGIWDSNLSIGSTGQVVKVGSGGALEFGTVSSDFVKIAEVNVTTNTAIATFDNVFSSSDGYDNYFLTFRQMIPATNGVALRIRYLNSSGSTVSTNYRWVNNGTETNSSGSTNNGQYGGSFNDSEYQVVGTGGTISNDTNNNGVSGTVNFYNPELSGKTQAIGDYVMVRNPLDNLFQMAHASVIEDTQVMRGFIMFFSSGDIANGKMTLYGRK